MWQPPRHLPPAPIFLNSICRQGTPLQSRTRRISRGDSVACGSWQLRQVTPGWTRLPELRSHIAFGASPRASIFLVQAARAHAYLRGRWQPSPGHQLTAAWLRAGFVFLLVGFGRK